MHRLLHSLVATSLLAHAVLGCCAHELHHDGGGAVCQHEQGAAATHGECSHTTEHLHHESTVDDAREHDGDPAAPLECRHQTCKWTAGDSQRVDVPGFAADCVFLALCDTSTLTIVAELPSTRQQWLAQGSFPLPVRAHLALGILLI